LLLSENAKAEGWSVKESDHNYIAVDGKYLKFKQIERMFMPNLSDKAVSFIMKKRH
jgi:hypothetical protein